METVINKPSKDMMPSIELSLKEQLKQALNLPEDHFDRHETDLYVKASVGVRNWLKDNYKLFYNIKSFKSQIDGSMWFDIPFAAWDQKYRRKF
jgi:hypothetical protein